MKEKELRLALVCYGGVSLAVYMHGITKEIHKLIRASSLLHQTSDAKVRQNSSYVSVNTDRSRETDTEIIYYDILKTIGTSLDLRVILDIVAGASAGGINGIMLARAITEDLSLDPLRKLWLENADIEKLLDPAAISSRWSKWYMRPLLWLINTIRKDGLDEALGSEVAQEVRMKLSRFVRSRWFKPPFSGPGFARMLLDAVVSLGEPDPRSKALLPPGYPFDLFVTVTDFYGHAETLKIHSPREVQEREHRLVISFHDSGTDLKGHRNIGDAADLAFAARCTASFPGAFPPATLTEMDHALQQSGQSWRGRTAFVRRALADILASGADPEAAAFIDGSVLNNKPFGQAISALTLRPAYREVDRRIIYIEPNPVRSSSVGRGSVPGFFHSIRASLSDIPRNQPIRDDLEWLAERSERAGRMRQILAGMSDDVDAAIESALATLPPDTHLTADYLRSSRNAIHEKAASSAGFTYGPYVELKTNRLLTGLSRHLSDITRVHPGTTPLAAITDCVDIWSQEKGLKNIGLVKPVKAQDEAPAWLDFLAHYDLSYRIRRLRFVIRRLNALYAEVAASDLHSQIDIAKGHIYSTLSGLVIKTGSQWLPESLRATLRDSLAKNSQRISHALHLYQEALALKSEDATVDAMMSALLSSLHSEVIRSTILRSYLGFAFYDIAMLPVLQSDDMDEFDAIKVDRIAPDDCTSLRKGLTDATLKGVRFGNFGAFFSRAYRENDYLWGRLHGAERMIDILLSSLPDGTVSESQYKIWKRDIFKRIIDRERSHLKTISPLFDQLERELSHLT